jgi:hypothetical protein
MLSRVPARVIAAVCVSVLAAAGLTAAAAPQLTFTDTTLSNGRP